MSSLQRLLDIRSEVYLRINIRRIAGEYTYDLPFTVHKTYKPWTALEDTFKEPEKGKVYVIPMAPGDLDAQSRSRMAPRDFCIQVGFQKPFTDINDFTEGDKYVRFMGELEDVCRFLVYPPDSDHASAFLRIEYLRDPDGMPLSFTMLRQTLTFEAYFNAYYRTVLEGYDPSLYTTTSTTTTT